MLIPIPVEEDWLGRTLRPSWQPVAWPIVYSADEETPTVELMLRNDGVGPALVARARLHGRMVSWEAEADRRVLPPSTAIRLRFHLRHHDLNNPQEVEARRSAAEGEFTVAVDYADVLGARSFETRVITQTPQIADIAATHVRQGFQVREGDRFVMQLEWADAYFQDNPQSRGTEWSPDSQLGG